ncbi:MAG: aminotransferase class III-fold pyridoxal phosphate-dependent enzyme [Gammaproteobacteria bacterium]|nr:aminotransferase class III-fold pyridoxal phosphate-dependent enzyme [Gammaproteobacteria bacterium]MYE28233.1 aminotransferase class III-fold pyridoxal phosphate-dependent enzyme [Gammaproteobacteria bacterium]MYI01869.1 aminotransferase class III-fold pyridoxal phosphate-dependent enzyme [Gammaproteobacteria bacterium]
MNRNLHDYSGNRTLFERANRVIPNGISGHFNPQVQKPLGTYPYFVRSGEGARFRDVDGNEYIDFMCAYGPMILGYGNPVVDAAFEAQVKQADTCSLASPVMVELAEYLVELIPAADWATFAKNGADATNMAVLIARAATGRQRLIAIEGGYHGSSPWMQSAEGSGIGPADHENVTRIPWNDIAALRRVLDEHEGEVAAFIASPYHHPVFRDNELPAEGYWREVHQLLKKHGVVSICDDVRAGFRIDMRGSNEYFGYRPDLICYCKAIANGYPISAVVGADSLKDAAGKIYQSGSFWFSAGPMAAALACLKELARINAPARILKIGRKFTDGLTGIAADQGLVLKVTGMPSMPYLRLEHEAGIEFHQKLCGECARRGLFMASHHNLFVSAAHSGEDLEQAFAIFDEALAAVRVGN